MRNLLITLILVFLVSSCTSKLDHEKVLESWMGAKESALIDKWGTPTNHLKLMMVKNTLLGKTVVKQW